MTSPETRETKAYKTYLGYATCVIPPKKARKFKKSASPKLTTVPVSPEEPTRKSKRVKRPAKKSTNALTIGVVIRDTLVMYLAKKKEKVIVEDEDDDHNDQDSRSEGSDQESDSGDDNSQSDKERGSDSEHETDENELGFESDQEENEEDVEDDEEERMTSLLKPRPTIPMMKTKPMLNQRMNELVNTDKGFIQKEGTDGDMINVQQENENLEITLDQVIEDAHVTISTVPKKTKVPVTSSSHSSELAAKFLNFVDIHVLVITESLLVFTTVILQSFLSFTPLPSQSTPTPPPITEATNPLSTLLNFTSVFQFNRVSTLEKEVVKLKKDDLLNTQVTALVDEHLDSRLGATRDEFMSCLLASITTRITEQVKIQLPQILPKEVSNFVPSMIKSMVTESLKHAVLVKESSQPQSTYEAAALLTEFELKKILIDKMDESQSYLIAIEHKECYDGLIKSCDLDKNRGLKKRKTSKDDEPTKGLKAKESKSGSSKGSESQSKSSGKFVHEEELEFEVADSEILQDQEENLGDDDEEPKIKVVSKCDWFTKPKQPQEPTDLDWNVGKTPQQGPTQSWLMTLASYEIPKGDDYPFDLIKPLPLVMNRNHQIVPVDYFFNNDLKYLQGGISTMTYTTSIKKTKAAQYDLPGIEDMKRVKDLQLGVKSYQKKINTTKPETTKAGIKKRDPYTPYQDPQRFIYVDNKGRNRFMRSDELYKFSDGTLIGFRTLLDDITKNILIEYMP
uniref:Uncharacterized protein n=1 Tax=Tanacetum cinerariifolium TaxID=118510 RepID=A0A6L2NG53_TANCI|nr:hypothetical protein [Tanacetum cinerariifolium]